MRFQLPPPGSQSGLVRCVGGIGLSSLLLLTNRPPRIDIPPAHMPVAPMPLAAPPVPEIPEIPEISGHGRETDRVLVQAPGPRATGAPAMPVGHLSGHDGRNMG
jgi:hypothetical protein